ncbi:MAG: RDD family protein [Rubripirellula sp.]|nr:RDD family protein [Rubripirellula sp.]
MNNPHNQPGSLESDPFENAVNPYQVPTTQSHQGMPVDPRLASRLTRLGAVVVDGIISSLITFPMLYFTGFFNRALRAELTAMETTLMTLSGFAIFLALQGYLLATRGQTIGKMLVGIRIVDYTSGETVPFAKLIGLRYLPLWIVTIIPFLGNFIVLIDTLAIFTSERRCLHDLIAGTKVVEA